MRQKKDDEIIYDEIEYSNNSHQNRRKKLSSKRKEKKRKSPIRRFFNKILVFSLILIIISATLYLGFKGFVFKKLCMEMFNNSPSIIYDANKNIIAKIGSERNRDNVEYSDIPSNLINAYISIEDRRYFKHSGVDIKRTGGAIFSYIIHFGKSTFGGSTINQQLVKNLTGNDSNSASEK